MVARRILVPPVRVRILPRQLKERAKSLRFSSFVILVLPQNVRKCVLILVWNLYLPIFVLLFFTLAFRQYAFFQLVDCRDSSFYLFRIKSGEVIL